ncbi:hypothetical protein EDC04DRAFT_2616403 [Pisolithus marmoratus]|nr:hypothetical protein EDC04DRAFT_2616403 [Pisolithus marmoratus]
MFKYKPHVRHVANPWSPYYLSGNLEVRLLESIPHPSGRVEDGSVYASTKARLCRYKDRARPHHLEQGLIQHLHMTREGLAKQARLLGYSDGTVFALVGCIQRRRE